MQEVQLKDVCTFINGDRGKNYPSADKISKENIGVPFINAGLLLNNLVDWENMNYISEETFNKLGSGKIQKDDILYCLRGSLGKHAIIDFDGNGAIASSLVILRCNKEIIDPRFLLIQLDMDKIILQQNQANNGSSQPNLSANSVKQYNIKLTDMEKQKEIIYKFNKIAEIIKTRKEQIENLELLVKSQFVEMFGSQRDNEKNMNYGKIDDVAEIYLGLTHTPNYIENGVKFISAKNTSSDYLDLTDIKYISREEFEKAPNGAKPKIGDVLFSRVGSNLGHPVILDIDEELCTFVSLGFLRAKKNVSNYYLKYWMKDDFFYEQVKSKVVGGGQPNLNTGWLKEFKIIIPPIELQNQFAEFVKLIDKQKFVIVEIIMFYDIILKSILNNIMG